MSVQPSTSALEPGDGLSIRDQLSRWDETWRQTQTTIEERIRAAEQAVRETRAEMAQLRKQVQRSLGDEIRQSVSGLSLEDRHKALWLLYWGTEIPPGIIGYAFHIHASQVAVTAGPAIVGRFPCGHERPQLSRDRGPEPWCRPCETLAWQAREREQERLRSMPYREYLTTDHWRRLRDAALRRAHFKCQVCNAGDVRLNVHHRTYERRGSERADDLVVLCEPCHLLFHEQGRLAPHEDEP
jgi:hypothetical protein